MQDRLILNRYRPISEAGSGGFATVQLAWDTRIQRRVAIKCIQLSESDIVQAALKNRPPVPDFQNPYEDAPAEAPPNFENLPGLDEARTAAMLTDANIVGVYDFEVQGRAAYLIMEYVDGLTLTELLAEFGAELSIDAITAIFDSIAHALEVAHDNQVLHLDIKPDNILVNRQGQVKVTDFGLATLSDAAGFGAAGGGTIGYMPLEQMRQESLDARCDEWALASVAYEMLTGENPLFAPNLDQAEAAIEDAELVLPSLCRDDLDPEADDVLFYALDPEREERYDNVTDFAEELDRFLGNPVRGHKELAQMVGQAREDFEDERESAERVGFFDRFSGKGQVVGARVWNALSVALLGFVSLTNIVVAGGWASWVFWGFFALLVVAAILKPHLGSFLGLLALAAALISNEAYVIGILLVVCSAVWWFFVGRRGNAQANTALLPVLAGSFGFNQVSPLLIGFFLGVKESLANVALAILVSLALASFGSFSLMGWNAWEFWSISNLDVQKNLIAILQQAQTWCILGSWVLAALVTSLFCKRQTRAFAACGIVISTMLLMGGLVLGSGFASGFTSWIPEWYTILPTVGAGIVMLVVCALGVPIRSEE